MKRALVLMVVALGLLSTGCFGSGSGLEPVKVIPKDPTKLARCSIKKSQASPLVTEWPASEKSHLEVLMGERAVVVSYSGCELKILDGCRVEGEYEFVRTTLANDTVEISNEDDLYAKIPIGAVSLAGELERSGRLAVRTTVVGQERLRDRANSLPKKRACRGATHVITAVSVGAFSLVSGGSVGGRIGVDVGSAGAGYKGKQKESMVKSAGEAKACKKTRDEPHPDCSSPIQVFLMPVDQAFDPAGTPEPKVVEKPKPRRRRYRSEREREEDERRERAENRRRAAEKRAEERKRKAEERRRRSRRDLYPDPKKSVEVHFKLPEDGGRWNLLTSRGEKLCELPCTREVGPSSGFRVQLDADKKEDIKVVAVPKDLGYSPGRRVKAVPRLGSGGGGALIYVGLYGGIGATLLGGGLAFSGGKDSESDPSSACNGMAPGALCGAGVAIGAAGIGGAIAGLVVGLGMKPDGLDMTLMTGDSARAPVRVRLTVDGLRGTF